MINNNPDFKQYINLKDRIKYKLKNGIYTLQELAEVSGTDQKTILDIIDSLTFENVQSEDCVRFVEPKDWVVSNKKLYYSTLFGKGCIQMACKKIYAIYYTMPPFYSAYLSKHIKKYINPESERDVNLTDIISPSDQGAFLELIKTTGIGVTDRKEVWQVVGFKEIFSTVFGKFQLKKLGKFVEVK